MVQTNLKTDTWWENIDHYKKIELIFIADIDSDIILRGTSHVLLAALHACGVDAELEDTWQHRIGVR